MSVTLGSTEAVTDRRLRAGVATWEVARKIVLRVRWPATGITARSL